MNENGLLYSFLQSADRFLGWLKKPFAFKPGFFLHQLLGLLLAYQAIDLLWETGKQLYRNSTIPGFHSVKQFLLFSANNLLYFTLAIVSVIFLFPFYKRKKAAWTFFMGLAFSGILNWSISVLILLYAEYVTKTFISNGSDWISIAWILIGAIPSLLTAGLLLKKKIRAMHQVRTREIITALALAVAWILIIFQILPLLFFASAN